MGKVYTATWRLTKELDGVAGRRVSCGDRTVFIWSDVSTGGGGGGRGALPPTFESGVGHSMGPPLIF